MPARRPEQKSRAKARPAVISAAKGRQTLASLRELQRVTAGAIMNAPLNAPAHHRAAGRARIDNESSLMVAAAELIRPGVRLTSLERLSIYHRQYWSRLLDCLGDDYPGLRAVIGEKKFRALCLAYLERFPSRSFSLRNLGCHLVEFLTAEPHWADPHSAVALDLARLEWAQIQAFDSPKYPVLASSALHGQSSAKLRISLQPHLTLLVLNYPVDEFVLALRKQDGDKRSNSGESRSRRPMRHPRIPEARRTWVAVYRLDNRVYFDRLTRQQFDLLAALRDGATLEAACRSTLSPAQTAEQVLGWFCAWLAMGWLCRRNSAR